MSRESDSLAAGRAVSQGARGRFLGSLRAGRALSDEDFERLYEQHAVPLLSFLALRTGDRALAEDLLADTFERVLRKRSMFDRRRGSEKSWLYSIALNLLRDHARRSKVGQGATERLQFERTMEPSSRDLDQVEDRDVVGRVLGELSAEEREAVALRFGADLTVPEIAELTGNSLTTMEGRVYRALRKLRVELEEPSP
ncbi:MAG TPA: sigma-70 family RNA polymerase sigma factor [Solirubrobacterales bacterium]|nr:sigma-70 family RNA polymerase sigma factor [Solirubrobacterales bacterium]